MVYDPAGLLEEPQKPLKPENLPPQKNSPPRVGPQQTKSTPKKYKSGPNMTFFGGAQPWVEDFAFFSYTVVSKIITPEKLIRRGVIDYAVIVYPE